MRGALFRKGVINNRKVKEPVVMYPSEYMANLRMEKAKKLLVDSELLIREIAVTCGFENEYYFSNFFKKNNRNFSQGIPQPRG